MNAWMDAAIPLAVTVVALAGLAIYWYQVAHRYQRENEALHDHHGACIVARDSFKTQLEQVKGVHETELENFRKYIDGLKEDLRKADDATIHYSNECDKLQRRLDATVKERDEAVRALNGLQSRLDTLGTEIKQSRTRKKPLAKVEVNNE